MGRIMNLKGELISGAKVEIWQTDAKGRYKNPSDLNPVPADPNFQGYSTQLTDEQGRYHFKTIKPAPSPVLFLCAQCERRTFISRCRARATEL